MVLRLLDYWRGLAAEGELPAAALLRAADMDDMWRACFTLRLGGSEPVFDHIGDCHVRYHGTDLTGRGVAEAGANTLLGAAVSYLDEVMLRRIPITYGGTVPGPDGEEIPYRSILLPLSDDGETINAILGGANCRHPVFE